MTRERDERGDEVDPGLAVTWERLLKLARGSADVIEVVLPVAAGLTRDEVVRLLSRAASRQRGEALDALEQVWRLLGVVPRYRYEELMRRYETLRRRVDEAERGLGDLQRTMRREERDVEARETLDAWGALVKRTLAAPAGIVRSVTGIEMPALPAPEARPAEPAPPKVPVARKPAPRRPGPPRSRKRPTP